MERIDQDVQLALFGDDLSCFVKDKPSYEHLIGRLQNFSATCISGLITNVEMMRTNASRKNSNS